MGTDVEKSSAQTPAQDTSTDDDVTVVQKDVEKQGQQLDLEDDATNSNLTTTPSQQAPLSRVRSIKQNLGKRPECFRNTFQEVSFVAQATIALATSSFLVGATSIVTASIGRDLGMSQGEITWISASTTLTAGAFQLAVGQLADLLGRKLVFLCGMGSFCALILLTAFARNPFWMDIVLGFAGISCAMVVPPAVGILGAAYGPPSKRKNLAFSAFSAGNPLGFVLGSITCGIATRIFDWRASFIFIAILWGLFTIGAFWSVPNVENFAADEPLKQRMSGFFQQFDTLGAVLTLLGTGMLAAGLTQGPSDGWESPTVICLMVIGIIMLVVFGFWELKYPFPLMPPQIWKDKNFSLILAVTVLGFMSFTSSAFWLAFFMQQMLHWDALTVAVHLMPQAIAGLLWNVIVGQILHRMNNSLIMAVGSVSYLVANLLLALMKSDSNYWAFIFPALVLNVVGADFQFNVANMYVMQSLPSHQQSLAGGIMNTLVRLSSTIALGISTAVYSSTEIMPVDMADPMVKYTRAFQVSVGLAAASILFVPFISIGTQGNAAHKDTSQLVENEKSPAVDGVTEK